MKLAEFPKKVKYSMTEYHLFETLPKRGRRIAAPISSRPAATTGMFGFR